LSISERVSWKNDRKVIIEEIFQSSLFSVTELKYREFAENNMRFAFRKLLFLCLVGFTSLSSASALTGEKGKATEKNKGTRTPAQNARIVDFSVANGTPLHISFSDGTDIEIPLEKGRFGNSSGVLRQTSFEDVQVAEDGKHIGWLADYMICAQSYPCHAELVIYQPGKKLKYIPPPVGVIWDWGFVGGGTQVLVHSGFPHGDDTGISTIYDADTGHAQVTTPKKPPER
jgi:hypothetical protein